MDLFGIKSKEKLGRAEKVLGRDKRLLQQFQDIEELHSYKKLTYALIAGAIFAFIIFKVL